MHYSRSDYPPAFELAWSILPKRDANNPKKLAYKQWKARVREGVSEKILEGAARAYHGYCSRKGILNTDKVMMAATFFGPNGRWEGWEGQGIAETPKMARTGPKSDSGPRLDARPFLKELIQGLAEQKKSPTCNYVRERN